MREACPSFHQTCNNDHKKGHFANVCMCNNKSLNYLDKQNIPQQQQQKRISSYVPFLIFQTRLQQPTNQHNCQGLKHRVFSHTQHQRDKHFLQNRLWCSGQCNSRTTDWNSANKTKNNEINTHPKRIQGKQYTSKRKMNFRYPKLR